MKKKLLSILLCIIVFFNSFVVSQAATSELIEVTPDFSEEKYLESRIDSTVFEWRNPTPYYAHISSNSIGLGIFGNEAECDVIVNGYSRVNRISVYIYLQRYDQGKWTTIPGGAFHKESSINTIFFAPTKILDTTGSYRFTTQIFAYTKDGSTEYLELVSNTEVY